MGRGGFEPPASRLSSVCSKPLSYQPTSLYLMQNETSTMDREPNNVRQTHPPVGACAALSAGVHEIGYDADGKIQGKKRSFSHALYQGSLIATYPILVNAQQKSISSIKVDAHTGSD